MGQRVRNGQPDGLLIGDGMSPASFAWRHFARVGIGPGAAGEQRARIRMQRRLVDRLRRTDLDDVPEIHDGNPVGDVPHDRQIVRDEQVREAELLLQILHQVDHLRLNRDVERAHRLVGDDDLRIGRERAGDADALTLAAGELVRISVAVLAATGRPSRAATRRARRARPATASCGSSAALRRSARRVFRGLSDEYGSWKTIWMSDAVRPHRCATQRREIDDARRGW